MLKFTNPARTGKTLENYERKQAEKRRLRVATVLVEPKYEKQGAAIYHTGLRGNVKGGRMSIDSRGQLYVVDRHNQFRSLERMRRRGLIVQGENTGKFLSLDRRVDLSDYGNEEAAS